jgi:hypothetical protein
MHAPGPTLRPAVADDLSRIISPVIGCGTNRRVKSLLADTENFKAKMQRLNAALAMVSPRTALPGRRPIFTGNLAKRRGRRSASMWTTCRATSETKACESLGDQCTFARTRGTLSSLDQANRTL